MAPTREFKIGIVGCGRISQAYTQAIEECDNISIAAMMDTRTEAAKSSAEAAGCKAFTDIESFATSAALDGAVICAPPNVHRELACRLMEEGIHVLCEKPFATTREDAVVMVRKADSADLVLMMASKFRYVEDIIRAKAIVTSGMLGDVQFYENRFCSKTNMRGRWNSDPEIGGGGVLIDNGTHSVDIARYLLGPIRRIHAMEGKRVMGLPVEETARLSFETESGVMGSVSLSWSLSVDQADYINIHGTDGTLSIGWRESKYQYNEHPQWVSFGVGYNKVAAFKNQVTNFVDTIRGAARPIITPADGLASVEAIEAAYRSMETGQWVGMEEKPSVSNLVQIS